MFPLSKHFAIQINHFYMISDCGVSVSFFLSQFRLLCLYVFHNNKHSISFGQIFVENEIVYGGITITALLLWYLVNIIGFCRHLLDRIACLHIKENKIRSEKNDGKKKKRRADNGKVRQQIKATSFIHYTFSVSAHKKLLKSLRKATGNMILLVI